MVLKKRQDYGFYGYQVPVVPRAPRSSRRRSFKKESLDDGQLCAFELLAAVAGKLLQESESSASSNIADRKVQLGIHKDCIKKEQVGEERISRPQCLDQESCIESVIVPESAAPERSSKSTLKELPHFGNVSASEHISAVTNSNLLNKVSSDVKLKKCTSNNAAGSFPSKSEESFLGIGQICDVNIGDKAQRMSESVGKQNGHLNMANCSGSKDPGGYHVHSTHKPIKSEGSIKFPLYKDHVPVASFHKHRNNLKIVNRDDDENYFRSNNLNTKMKASRPQSRIGYRRMKKLMTSRNWRTAPKLIDYEFINIGRGDRPIYHKRKTNNACGGYQRDLHSKRRRLHDSRQMCHYRSAVSHDQQASSESISNSPEKAMKGDKSGTPLHRETGVSSSDVGHKAPFHAKDPRVKFSIKSFKVPELYIEVPETATVGSLKMTVMEAVTAILEGGLHVGVVLQGQRVKDDNRTLRQIGISHNDDLDTLGFTLEPNFVQATSPISHKDPALLLPCDKHQELSRSPVPGLDSGFLKSSYDQVPVTNLENHVNNNQEIVPYLTDVYTDVSVPKTLVPMPPMNLNTLAIVPLNQKAKRSDLSQRRTRRPFSVSEVEALVEAVEKLGTGRWRDVKMRSFDDVNHRTYVDLKDKWKTLVHTASIAPQQRRGQPVPQELLDRVLAAHAYWSQHQSKQHGKHQIEPLKLAGEVGV